MAARSKGRMRTLTMLVVLALCAGVGAVSAAPDPVRAPAASAAVVGAAAPVAGGVAGLAALLSVSPVPALEDGGGGLGTQTWGLFGDPTDDGAVMRADGVQVDLAAPGWGSGATFAVFDAGTTTQLWPASGQSTASVVPAG